MDTLLQITLKNDFYLAQTLLYTCIIMLFFIGSFWVMVSRATLNIWQKNRVKCEAFKRAIAQLSTVSIHYCLCASIVTNIFLCIVCCHLTITLNVYIIISESLNLTQMEGLFLLERILSRHQHHLNMFT